MKTFIEFVKENYTHEHLNGSGLIEAEKVYKKAVKKELISFIETVKEDCDSQSESLRETDDVNWHCYNIDSWESMSDNLAKALQIIKEKF